MEGRLKVRAMQNLPGDAVYSEMDSPVGVLTLVASSKGLRALLFDTGRQKLLRGLLANQLKKTDHHPIITIVKNSCQSTSINSVQSLIFHWTWLELLFK